MFQSRFSRAVLRRYAHKLDADSLDAHQLDRNPLLS